MAFQFPANPIVGQQFSPLVGLTYVWNGTGWTMIGPTPQSMYPPGFIAAYAGPANFPFQGWILCDGKSYTTATYPDLFTVLQYAYGGAGLNFNVPDLRGRVIAGRDNMGGVAAGRLVPSFLGSTIGAQSVTLTLAQIPAHNHPVTDPSHTHVVTDPSHAHGITDPTHTHGYSGGANPAFGGDMTGANAFVASYNVTASATGITINPSATGVTNVAAPTGLTINNTGGGGPFDIVQPTICLNYIIKT